MKIGYNEGSGWNCADHSVLKDLEYCEKYGFDCIDVQSACLNRDLEAGKYTMEELGEWFKTHRLTVNSYNALCFFNMKQTQAEKDAVMEELDEVIRRCQILNCDTVVVVPTEGLTVPATRAEIHADAVAVLRQMLEKVEPHGIKLALEFCGQPNVSINRFEEAYAIVQEIDHPLLGMVLDQYHFDAMASSWDAFEKADGKKIFVWHLNDMEDFPCGAAYNTYACRLWPGDPRGCMDHQRYANTLRKIGFAGDACVVEVFRPEYYELTQEENVKAAAACTRAHVEKYCSTFA